MSASGKRKKKPLVTACSGCEEEIVLEGGIRAPGEKVWHFDCLPPMIRPRRKMKLPKAKKAKETRDGSGPQGPKQPTAGTVGAWVTTDATSAADQPQKTRRGRRKKKVA
jgi:hypothetical protein